MLLIVWGRIWSFSKQGKIVRATCSHVGLESEALWRSRICSTRGELDVATIQTRRDLLVGAHLLHLIQDWGQSSPRQAVSPTANESIMLTRSMAPDLPLIRKQP